MYQQTIIYTLKSRLAGRPAPVSAQKRDTDWGDARRGTQIICRQGSPLVGLDLDRVSAQHARSVVVLSDDALRPDQADARSLRVALSVHETPRNPGLWRPLSRSDFRRSAPSLDR